jgi:hypothetical protein
MGDSADFAEACCLGDLAEPAPDVVLVEHRADCGREHQPGVLPRFPRRQTVRGLGRLALAEGGHGDL